MKNITNASYVKICAITRSASKTVALAIALLALSAFAAPAQAPAPAPQTIDLSRMVVIGDSLPAGMQNFSLLDAQQVHAFPAVIAQQAGVSLTLPMIPSPGVPNVLQLVTLGPPPVVAQSPGSLPPVPRDNPTQQATNLAVPGVTVADVLNKRPGATVQSAVDALTNIILGFPTPFVVPGPPLSQVEQAVALNPTAILIWVGNNDILLSLMSGDPSQMTPVSDFSASYTAMLAALAQTNARILVANIPDVTAAPYFMSVDEIVSETGMPQGQVMKALGVGPHDYLRPGALTLAFQILQGQAAGPLPQVCPASVPGLPITSAPCVLTSAQAAAARTDIDALNAAISSAAASYHATVVDTHALIARLASGGVAVNGYQLTFNYLGGLTTLDGVHPTNTLHAIVANTFIDLINAQFGTTIPDMNVDGVAAADPLVIPSLLQPAQH